MASTIRSSSEQSTSGAAKPPSRLRWLVAVLAVAAVGQFLLDQRAAVGWGAALLGLGAVLFALLAPVPVRRPRTLAATPFQPVRFPFLVASILLGIAAIPGFAANQYTLPGTLAWLGSLGCVAAALWPSDNTLRWPTGLSSISLSGPSLLVLLAVIVGAFLRLHRIHTIPLEMGCDLPLIHANIAQILHGEYPIFFDSHPGREGLFFYLAAPIAAMAGLSHVSIKVAAALVGVVSIPAVYWLGREVFDPWTGALAAYLLAISHWHIILSRMGYRAVLVPLLVALCLVFLVRGLRRGSNRDYALCALCVGLGIQSYNAFMVVPPMVGLVLVLARMLRRRLGASIAWRSVALWVLVVLLTALPLLCYAAVDPQRYLYRVATRATAIEVPLPETPLVTWLGNTGKAAAMFNYWGDSVYVSNIPGHRQLGFATAVFFVLGMGHCARRRPSHYTWLLWCSLVGLMLPSTLALAFPDEVPSAVRSIGALPAVMLFAAFGFRVAGGWVWQSWGTGGHQSKVGARILPAALGLAIALALLAETVAVYPLYFTRYVAAQPNQNQSISLEMARVIDDFAGNGQAYILVAPFWYDGNAVRAQFVRTPADWSNELQTLEPGAPPMDDAPGRVLVIVHPDDQQALELLNRSFGQHVTLEHRWRDGSVAFMAFYGER